MAKLCCPECFGDRGLRRDIIPSLSPSTGNCNYCGATSVDLIEPVALRDVFELLVSIYEPDHAGKSLVEWLKDDWDLFSHSAMDVAHAKELLGEILDDGDIVRKPFSPSATYHSEALARWETLRDELMYKNRYFLDEVLDTDRLKELLDHLPADGMPTKWYRARILTGDTVYPIDQMSAPPARLATHGRANPAGIPYLYLGSLPSTAAAEMRPPTGEVACVAEFTVAPPLRAVDLRNPRGLVSPFVLADANAIGQLRADIAFLERLGDELTRPVLPRGAAIDYIPSQYLCEFIKKAGYDGVVYRSSVSNGINLALFSPIKAIGGRGIALQHHQGVSRDRCGLISASSVVCMQDWYAGARLIIRRRRPDLDRMAPSPQAVAHPEKVRPRRSILRSSSGWLSSAWVGEAPARRAVRCDRLADEAEWQAVATRPVSYYHMMAGENRKIAERAGAALVRSN